MATSFPSTCNARNDGIQDSRIDDETDRQAIILRPSKGVTVKGTTFTDPDNHR